MMLGLLVASENVQKIKRMIMMLGTFVASKNTNTETDRQDSCFISIDISHDLNHLSVSKFTGC